MFYPLNFFFFGIRPRNSRHKRFPTAVFLKKIHPRRAFSSDPGVSRAMHEVPLQKGSLRQRLFPSSGPLLLSVPIAADLRSRSPMLRPPIAMFADPAPLLRLAVPVSNSTHPPVQKSFFAVFHTTDGQKKKSDRKKAENSFEAGRFFNIILARSPI